MLHFNCPQCYSDDDGKNVFAETFYRHVHFCISNENNTKWLSTLYTKIVVCNISFEEMMKHKKNGTAVLINALPSEYYAKAHIPNSYNLFSDTVKKMSEKQLHEWFKEVIKTNYPKLQKLLDLKKINIYEIPIITYCAHKDCSASIIVLENY